MKCSVCEKDIAWGEPTVAKKGQGVRHEACVPEKTKKEPTRSSQVNQENVSFSGYTIEAVGIRLNEKEYQGHTWYGETRADALATMRSFLARRHNATVNIEEEGEDE